MVQQNRKMDETVAITVKKMQPVVYSFTYANKFLSTEWMRRLYFTHIYPHFLHAFSVWGTDNPRATYIQPLIKLQKKVVRILFRAHPRTSTKPLMHKLQILNITNLYIYRVCLETHPYIYTTDNITRPDHDHNYLFASEIHDYPTRYSLRGHHYVPNPYKYSKTCEPKLTMPPFQRKYSDIRNSLPEWLRAISDFKTFKKALKTYLLEKQSKPDT